MAALRNEFRVDVGTSTSANEWPLPARNCKYQHFLAPSYRKQIWIGSQTLTKVLKVTRNTFRTRCKIWRHVNWFWIQCLEYCIECLFTVIGYTPFSLSLFRVTSRPLCWDSGGGATYSPIPCPLHGSHIATSLLTGWNSTQSVYQIAPSVWISYH